MATDIAGLFGLTPESYQMAQEQAAQAQAMKFAEMDPFQRANYGLFMGGRQLGGAIGQALGAQDPQLQKISTINALSKQFDVTTPEGLTGMANALKDSYPDVALQVAAQAQAMQKAGLETKKQQLSITQEENLRKELSALGPEATQEDILAVVTKYGSADKVLAALQGSADKAAQRQQALQIAKDRSDALIEAARVRGESQETLARMQIEARRDLATLAASLKQGQQAAKPLSTQDLKMTNELTNVVNDATYGIGQADKFISMLNKGELKFGAIENIGSKARALAGSSNPSDVAKSDLEKWMTGAVNAVLNQAKGVQAKDDAERARKQVIEAIDKNDPKLVLNAVQRVKTLLQNTQDDAIGNLELIGRERNRDLTGGLKTTTKNDPLGIR